MGLFWWSWFRGRFCGCLFLVVVFLRAFFCGRFLVGALQVCFVWSWLEGASFLGGGFVWVFGGRFLVGALRVVVVRGCFLVGVFGCGGLEGALCVVSGRFWV